MLFSVLTRKGRSLGTTSPAPLRSRSWLKRQISAAAPKPYPAVTTEGARCPGPNWPSDSSGQPTAGARPHRLWPRQRATAITSQRWGSGRSPLPPQGLLTSGQSWQGFWSSAGHSPLTWGLLSWNQDPLLTSLSAWGPRLCQVCWTDPLRVTHEQLAACRRTLAPTNGWAEPLTVTHWQSAACGRGTEPTNGWVGPVTMANGPAVTSAY